LNEICTFILVASVWVIQIAKNCKVGSQRTPGVGFVFFTSAHVLLIPIYIRGFKCNFLHMEPRINFTIALVSYTIVQIIILLIQQRKPRFCLPRSWKIALIGKDYHEYEFDFEAEAARSSDSYLTPLLTNRPRPGLAG